MLEIKGKYTTAKVMIDDIEPQCYAQITQFVNHPAFTNPVAMMPDTHFGKSAAIGFTMKMTDKIIPNVIGVDIGCGMLSADMGPELDVSLEELDLKIRNAIPFGFEVHNTAAIHMKNDFPWYDTNVMAEKFSAAYFREFGIRIEPPKYTIDWLTEKARSAGVDPRRIINSMGSLGGGNHFIEIGRSENGHHWLTIHCGSRQFGLKICEYWQNKAAKILTNDKRQQLQNAIIQIKEDYKQVPHKIKEEITAVRKRLGLDSDIKLNGLEWLEGEDAVNYLYDMIFAQKYAEVNRKYIFKIIMKALRIDDSVDTIETVHNYINFNDFVIRKGAISSYEDERMIIPFNMRDGILLCKGKSNTEWNYSAPHGAGRVMGRNQAKKQLSLKDFENQMSGIYSTSVCASTLDEAPDAYKNATMIEQAIQPTAIIINRIKPIHNMKDKGVKKHGR